MDQNKDYYAILGVLPTAEDVVIRAAYKALAQRYHPDRTGETGPDASKRMASINEAYSVLSDAARRKAYDALRGSNTPSGGSYFDDDEDAPPAYDPLEKEWAIAVTFYPDLPQIEARLSKLAWRLAYSFRAYMLAEKAFEKRAQVAAAMELKFMELYFGSNPKILDFARTLISGGHKAAAKALNKAISVLGSSADPNRVISQIQKDYFPQAAPSATKSSAPDADEASRKSHSKPRATTPPPAPPTPTSREQLIALPFAGPWRRFFARYIDLGVIGFPVGIPVVLSLVDYSPGFGQWLQGPFSSFMLICLLQALVLFIEGIIFAMFGTTLGKALLGVVVVTADGQRPTAGQYLSRQMGVYWYGLGMGLPLITLFTAGSQYRRLKSGNQAGYDEGKFKVKARKLGVVRVLSAIFLVLAILLIGIASSMVPSSFKKSASAPSGNERQTTNNSDNATEIVSEGQKPLYAAGKVFKDCADCPEMVVIPAGQFEMGTNNGERTEMPAHRVGITSFAMGKTEVTEGQWRSVMGNNPSGSSNCGDNCPVEKVSWDDAKSFIQRLNAKTGKTYRLPSEAEWEYACRAGGRQTYCGSDNVDSVSWFYKYSDNNKAHAVAGKQANAWGLYDMSGNVWEWTEDCWNDDYNGAPNDGSARTSGNCGRRVYRGGAWDTGPHGSMPVSRMYDDSSSRKGGVGFRLVRMLP